MFGHMRRYEAMRLEREKRKNQASFAAGATLGLIAGYCAKKYLAPKLSEIEYKAIVDKEAALIKDKFEDLKYNVVALKDRLGFDSCCCCEDDDFEDDVEDAIDEAADTAKDMVEDVADAVDELKED